MGMLHLSADYLRRWPTISIKSALLISSESIPTTQRKPLSNRHCTRYGQRALVNENVGSLVNTLTLHKTSDLRLEAFARLLSEEWDVGIFIDFLNAQAMALQVL
jgi:hypothetical protein